MMRPDEQKVPFCFTALPACASRLGTLNEIASPIVPASGTLIFRTCWLKNPAHGGLVEPSAVNWPI
ncbi:MAG: hypothetical protein WA553_17345, partial [Methylocella sp.]